VDSFAIGADGSVTAYNGHVDLGTGVRTALGQLVADELYVDFAAVTMVLGHTARTPDLGPTIASNTIQVSSLPMRHAAAQVRQLLIKLASENPVFPLTASPPRKALSSPAASARLWRAGPGPGSADRGRRQDRAAQVRLRYIGKSVQRVDIPNKVLARADLYPRPARARHAARPRDPSSLHRRRCHGSLGSSLVSVDEKSIAHLPGIVKVVVKGDFVGVVAEREEQAIAAMRQLKVTWKNGAACPICR
jgi:CO/xanthine dehydrogenase Mo-binding subunit